MIESIQRNAPQFKQKHMQSITLKAPAKINLALRVGNRRADGFHEIRSLMQAISLYDEITISITEPGSVEEFFFIDGPQSERVPTNYKDNLTFLAVALIRENYPDIPSVKVDLIKNIPVGAGLGGGSSDAAAALIGMNRLFNLGFDRAMLTKLGAALGSDVPFFFSSGSALVSGRGEIIEEIELPLDYHLALITPPERVSTTEAYRVLNRPQSAERDDDTGLTLFEGASTFYGSGTISDLLPALLGSGNDFEDKFLEVNGLQNSAEGVAESLGLIRKQFRSLGSRLTRLSGSGSAVFGIFDSAVPHERLQAVLREGWLAHSARPISLPADSSP